MIFYLRYGMYDYPFPYEKPQAFNQRIQFMNLLINVWNFFMYNIQVFRKNLLNIIWFHVNYMRRHPSETAVPQKSISNTFYTWFSYSEWKKIIQINTYFNGNPKIGPNITRISIRENILLMFCSDFVYIFWQIL